MILFDVVQTLSGLTLTYFFIPLQTPWRSSTELSVIQKKEKDMIGFVYYTVCILNMVIKTDLFDFTYIIDNQSKHSKSGFMGMEKESPTTYWQCMVPLYLYFYLGL
jgi:hypothetical protein